MHCAQLTYHSRDEVYRSLPLTNTHKETYNITFIYGRQKWNDERAAEERARAMV